MTRRRLIFATGIAVLATRKAAAFDGTPVSGFLAGLNRWINTRNHAPKGTIDVKERSEWRAVRKAWHPFRRWIDWFYRI